MLLHNPDCYNNKYTDLKDIGLKNWNELVIKLSHLDYKIIAIRWGFANGIYFLIYKTQISIIFYLFFLLNVLFSMHLEYTYIFTVKKCKTPLQVIKWKKKISKNNFTFHV